MLLTKPGCRRDVIATCLSVACSVEHWRRGVELRDSLRAAIGPDVLLEDAADVAPLLIDHRGLYQGRALAVALPRNVDEVSRLLAWCNAQRVGVVPQGGNTGYCGGATPDDSGTATAGRPAAAATASAQRRRRQFLDDRRSRLHARPRCSRPRPRRERYFPLELGSADSCQIGGNLATNAGGLNVLRYGMARALDARHRGGAGRRPGAPAPARAAQGQHRLRPDRPAGRLRRHAGHHHGGHAASSGRRCAAPRTALVAVPDVAAAVALLARLRDAGRRARQFLRAAAAQRAGAGAARTSRASATHSARAHPWYVLCELSSLSG